MARRRATKCCLLRVGGRPQRGLLRAAIQREVCCGATLSGVYLARTNSKHPSRTKSFHVQSCRYVQGLLDRGQNLKTFNTAEEAEAEGYRACLVCVG